MPSFKKLHERIIILPDEGNFNQNGMKKETKLKTDFVVKIHTMRPRLYKFTPEIVYAIKIAHTSFVSLLEWTKLIICVKLQTQSDRVNEYLKVTYNSGEYHCDVTLLWHR